MRPLKDDKVLGMEPVSEVDVRSRVCREAASDEDAASVASGDGDNAWELTSLRDTVSNGLRADSRRYLQILQSCEIGQTAWKRRTHLRIAEQRERGKARKARRGKQRVRQRCDGSGFKVKTCERRQVRERTWQGTSYTRKRLKTQRIGKKRNLTRYRVPSDDFEGLQSDQTTNLIGQCGWDSWVRKLSKQPVMSEVLYIVNITYNDATCPEVSQLTPVQAQKLTF